MRGKKAHTCNNVIDLMQGENDDPEDMGDDKDDDYEYGDSDDDDGRCDNEDDVDEDYHIGVFVCVPVCVGGCLCVST